jgi:RNA polymerase sigma factor (sigma-70 family)
VTARTSIDAGGRGREDKTIFFACRVTSLLAYQLGISLNRPVSEGDNVAKVVLKRITGVLRKTAHKEQLNLSDSELIDQFRKHGDEEAFAMLVRRHGKAVHAACRQVLSDPADIDDAFQAVFLVLLQKIGVINGTRIDSWLYAVAHRIAVRAYSESRRRTKREGAAASRRQNESPSPNPSWREAIAILHEELDRLPDAYRRVLLLCYLSGQSREEVASSLGWTPGTVKGRLERGRKMLASRLAKRGIALSIGLLAVVTGNSVGMDGPPTRLIELAVREATESSNPTVSDLARGAFPMATEVKKGLMCVVAIAGVAVMTGLGLAISPLTSSEKDAQPITNNRVSSDPPTTGPQKTPEAKKPTHVIVKESTGTPVAGATVIASHKGSGTPFTFTTDAKGQFNFDASITGHSSGYTAIILAVKDGYAPTQELLPVNTDEVVLTLPDTAEYKGIVKVRAGQPIKGAEVQFGVVTR